MKTLIAIISVLTIATSCSPIYLVNREAFRKIPYGSKKVVIEARYSADSLFNNVAHIFLREGWAIDADRSLRQIKSNGKSIGYGTYLIPHVYVQPTDFGSVCFISGEWGLDAAGQAAMSAMTGVNGITRTKEIVFDGSPHTKPSVAFQQLILFAENIPGGQIFFQIKD